MKLDLRENMYIRTKNGIIDKILKLNKSYVKGVSQKDELYAYDIDNIVKASYNIIGILEVGDIISFYEDIDNYKKQYVIGIPDLITLDNIKDKITNDNIRLVSILTKEEMEQRAYKVGEWLNELVWIMGKNRSYKFYIWHYNFNNRHYYTFFKR